MTTSDERLVPVAERLWVVEQPLRFLGIEIGTRMTVAQLDDGSVWLHSPVALDDALVRELEAIGRVRYIVAPNRMHHLFAGDAKERFSDAQVFLAPGLKDKRPDLAEGTELRVGSEPPWGSEILVHPVGGLRALYEVVFFHQSSRTLIVCDLAFNIRRDAPWATRQFGRLAGAFEKLGCPTDLRLFFIADRKAFAASIATMRQWNFEHIILSHGHIVTENARAAFDAAFAFARDDAP